MKNLAISTATIVVVALIGLNVYWFLAPDAVPYMTAEGCYEKSYVKFEWDRNDEKNIKGYRVHLGNKKGVFNKSVDVGNEVTHKFPQLEANTNYFIAISAYTNEGSESPKSELIAFETCSTLIN